MGFHVRGFAFGSDGSGDLGDIGRVVRAGNAAGDGGGGKLAVIKTANWLNVAAQVVEPGADLKRGAEKKLGAHGFEVVLLQGAFDAGEAHREFLQVFFIGREVAFLKFFDLESFQEVDGTASFLVRFPIEEGGFGDAEFLGDGAVTPAVGAQGDEGVERGRLRVEG